MKKKSILGSLALLTAFCAGIWWVWKIFFAEEN